MGHGAVCSALRSREEFISNSRHKPVLYLRNEDKLFVFVKAYEQRVESACAGDVAADNELLLHVRAKLDPRA